MPVLIFFQTSHVGKVSNITGAGTIQLNSFALRILSILSAKGQLNHSECKRVNWALSDSITGSSCIPVQSKLGHCYPLSQKELICQVSLRWFFFSNFALHEGVSHGIFKPHLLSLIHSIKFYVLRIQEWKTYAIHDIQFCLL